MLPCPPTCLPFGCRPVAWRDGNQASLRSVGESPTPKLSPAQDWPTGLCGQPVLFQHLTHNTFHCCLIQASYLTAVNGQAKPIGSDGRSKVGVDLKAKMYRLHGSTAKPAFAVTFVWRPSVHDSHFSVLPFAFHSVKYYLWFISHLHNTVDGHAAVSCQSLTDKYDSCSVWAVPTSFNE